MMLSQRPTLAFAWRWTVGWLHPLFWLICQKDIPNWGLSAYLSCWGMRLTSLQMLSSFLHTKALPFPLFTYLSMADPQPTPNSTIIGWFPFHFVLNCHWLVPTPHTAVIWWFLPSSIFVYHWLIPDRHSVLVCHWLFAVLVSQSQRSRKHSRGSVDCLLFIPSGRLQDGNGGRTTRVISLSLYARQPTAFFGQ